ncbi:MAG TPA: UbiD family decarboxylase [Desulfosporosinus sp.]|nr:UbiD family decarboxylase [Desulfosporosinus sp.]
MQTGIREYLKILEENNELVVVDKKVNPLHVSGLITDTKKAVWLKDVDGYDLSIAGGLVRDVQKIALGLHCRQEEIGPRILAALQKPLPTVTVSNAPLKEIIIGEKDVDLTLIPQIMQHEKDGGPYIGSGVQFVVHEKWGKDAGMYRHMYRTINTMGVDFNSPNDIRMFYAEAQEQGKPLEMAVAIGLHPIELLSADCSAPTGVYEMTIAGALRGEPLQMIKCETIDVEVPANAEIVLECEVLPTGWITDEGRYGEFHGISGDVKKNPVVRVKTITRRKDAIFHSLIMPWEVYGLGAPNRELQAYNILKAARLRPHAVRSTVGACNFFELIVSLDHPKPGEGKAAIVALMSIMGLKSITVVDDDIDIYDDDQIRWAIALRVQPDKDVVIVSNLQAKHVDPSVRSAELPKGQLPTTSKMGIDATIPVGIPRKAYERLQYFNPDNVHLSDYL